MKTEIQKAVVDMMKKVKFIEDNHRYEDLNGNWLQGVSTVSSIVPKEWLSAWGAKEAVKALGYSDYEDDTELAEEILCKIKNCKSVKEYIGILKDAKGASRRKSKLALVDGKEGHEWLEKYVKAKIRKTKLPKLPDGNLERPISHFLEWEKENVDYWILSEARVAYPEKGYAGTLDGMAVLKNGKLAIIDFKFASHISEDYYLQTAGYAATFEPYGIKVDERVIIRLPKTLYREEWDKKEHKYKKVENNIEVEIVKTNYEEDKNVFFHCLPLKQWINKMENNKK
jgi:hypothetical protein